MNPRIIPAWLNSKYEPVMDRCANLGGALLGLAIALIVMKASPRIWGFVLAGGILLSLMSPVIPQLLYRRWRKREYFRLRHELYRKMNYLLEEDCQGNSRIDTGDE